MPKGKRLQSPELGERKAQKKFKLKNKVKDELKTIKSEAKKVKTKLSYEREKRKNEAQNCIKVSPQHSERVFSQTALK